MESSGATAPPGNVSHSARLSDLVVVIMRIIALKIGLDAVSFMIAMFARPQSSGLAVIFFAVLLALSAIVWHSAAFLARRVTTVRDPFLEVPNLTLVDLYAFAFVLVGLYFICEALGPSLTWLHYSLIHTHSDTALSPQAKANFYTLFKYLTKLLLGLAFVFNGRKFAPKLIRKQSPVSA